jgi:hypothetical protein
MNRMYFLLLAFLLVACGGPAFTAGAPASEDDAAPWLTADAGASVLEASVMQQPEAASALVDAALVDTGAMKAAVEATTADTGPMCFEPTSPLLTGTSGASGGIQFHVTHDTTLTSFTFTGSGVQDLATLSDDQCNPIASASLPNEPLPGYVPIVVNVNWPLKAGTSYRVTSAFAQTAYSGNMVFPRTEGEFVIEKGLVSCYGGMDEPEGSQVWSGFTNLTFCP